ncbi:MAG: 3'(2'),5'-bisphosphate nucleotidase [Pyrinomonadaceae bacterium]|nr:3'(2'),5'-bisphosphate nucleotidase [Phycisphaerales bacterium]
MNILALAAREAVLRASEVCRVVQRNLDRVRAITKDDRSPVTVADFAAQAVVAKVLSEHLGEIHLVAEESSTFLRDPGHEAHLEAATEAARTVWSDVTPRGLLDAIDIGGRHHGGVTAVGVRGPSSGIPPRNPEIRNPDPAHPAPPGFWTLDPIDGTKGFLRGHQYAVCLAYIVGDSPVLGLLGCPNLPSGFAGALDQSDASGCLYVSVKGEGVFESACLLEAMGSAPRGITRAGYNPGDAVTVCESFEPSHTKQDATARVMELLLPTQCNPPVRIDSQCKYALVARGQADVYLRLPTRRGYVERIWDHASGALIASEMNCVVSDARGIPLDFSQGPGLEKNRGIVAAPAGLHDRIIDAIRRLGLDAEPS